MGNLPDALKLYTRGMREYCTSPNQIIQVYLCETVTKNIFKKFPLDAHKLD